MSPVRIYGDQGYLELKAPVQSSNTTLVLPSGTGSNGDFIQSDGTGNFTYGSVSASGSIVSSHQFLSSGTFSATNQTYVPVLSGVFTPVRANSKVYLQATLGQTDGSNADSFIRFQVTDGSNVVIEGGTSIHNTNNTNYKQSTQVSMNYLDTPSYTLGDEIQYVVQFNNNANSGTMYVRNGTNVLTLLEVAQ